MRPIHLSKYLFLLSTSLIMFLPVLAMAALPTYELVPDSAPQIKCATQSLEDGSLLVSLQPEPGGKFNADKPITLADLRLDLMDWMNNTNFVALEYSSDTWYGSTFWQTGDWTRVGRDWQHPGTSQASVRTFTAPQEGDISITGQVQKLHLAGDGIRATILCKNREVWSGEINGDDGTGLATNANLQVRKGDIIRFIVHKRYEIACDTTGWDPVISYKDGPTYKASAGFDECVAGKTGPWSFEGQDAVEQKPVNLQAFNPSCTLIPLVLEAGVPLVMHAKTELPVMILSSGPTTPALLVMVEPGPNWRLKTDSQQSGNLRLVLGASSYNDDADMTARLWVRDFPNATAARQYLATLTTPENIAACPCPETARVWNNALTKALQSADGMDSEMFFTVQEDWRIEDKITDAARDYSRAVGQHIAGAREILERLPDNLQPVAQERLNVLEQQWEWGGSALEPWRDLYLQTRLFKRSLLLANPEFTRAPLLFCKRYPPNFSHLVAQYFGWRQRPGGSLFILENPGRSLACRDLIGNKLVGGNFLSPCLSWDAKKIVFSWVDLPPTSYRPDELPINGTGPENAYFHLYEIDINGENLRQLTHGPYDDTMPTWLPEGDVVFCSTRRQGYSRCFGPEYSERWHNYTLHRLNINNNAVNCISYNDVSEWFPAVRNDGTLIYARWDYIDRDAVTHQNLWAARPDGSNPIAVWGNAAPAPHCTFQPHAIPNSDKIMFIASAHHSITAGPVCIVDPRTDNNSLNAVRRLTPLPFPEAESVNIPEYYEAPWPLSEHLFISAFSRERLLFQEHGANPRNSLGLYLCDDKGNRELLYRDPVISSTYPIPISVRRTPPLVANTLEVKNNPDDGEFLLTDVYQGLPGIERGTVKALRIVQIFPKDTYVANTPMIGMAGEENARAILGTVPVFADGSARFKAPANKALLFQALDADGLAVQTMRSLTYLQPGEKISCVGCHEPRNAAVPVRRIQAVSKPAARITAGEFDGEPFSYMRVVQPVLDQNCATCHTGPTPAGDVDLSPTPQNGFARSYLSLCMDNSFEGYHIYPGNTQKALVPRYVQRNQLQKTPVGGIFSARGSRLIKMLREGHHDVKLSAEEMHRIASWIDCNAIFYGTYQPEEQARQLAGLPIAMPKVQ